MTNLLTTLRSAALALSTIAFLALPFAPLAYALGGGVR